MTVLIVIGLVIVICAGIWGVGLVVLDIHTRPKTKIPVEDWDTKPNYFRIRQMERDIYGRIYTNMNGTLIDPDSPEGQVQAMRPENRAQVARPEYYEAQERAKWERQRYAAEHPDAQ